MINVQEFARRLSTLGADAFTSDDVVDLATAADVRISADVEIDATLAQRLLDQISPTLPVTGAQIAASQWPPPKSSRPAAPSCRSPALVPSTDRLISRPDPAVLGLRVAVGDPAPDELAGETAVPAFSATARLLAAAVDYDASCEPNSRHHHRLNFVLLSGSVRPGRLDAR